MTHISLNFLSCCPFACCLEDLQWHDVADTDEKEQTFTFADATSRIRSRFSETCSPLCKFPALSTRLIFHYNTETFSYTEFCAFQRFILNYESRIMN